MVHGKRSADAASADKNKDAEPSANAGKRSRVSRACDQCRANRERCDGSKPCRTCSSQNRECSYEALPKKRGIQPNYIRTLEVTLAWIFQTFPQAELQLSSDLPLEHSHVNKTIGSKDSESSEALHLAWRNSLVCKQLDQLLSGDSITSEGTYIGRTATGNSSGIEAISLPQLQATHATGTSSEPMRLDFLGQGATYSSNDTERLIRLPNHAWELLEYYFAFTHAWLPMTEKHVQLKLMYTYPAEGLNKAKMGLADHAELWSILALASSQKSDESAQAIRNTADGLIPSTGSNDSFEVPHIKAMINLALLDISEQQILAAWLRVGTVVSLLLLFRILEKLGPTTKWCRNVHLIAFVLESALASQLRAPTHLTPTYISKLGLVEEDGLDEWSPWRDPDGSFNESGMKPPTRALSSLNTLVKIALGTSERDSVMAQLTRTTTGGLDISIVFSLLKNAASKQGRFQPCLLINTSGFHDMIATSNVQIDGNILSQFRVDDASTALAHTSPIQFQQANLGQSQNLRNEMSFSNEIDVGSVVQETSPLTSGAQFAPQPGFDDGRLGSFSTPVNVFEEFDDILEHEDPGQQSQFYKNLGFAPDVVLAEFFGQDYQPSDPLLAYLNPSLYGTDQQIDY